MSDRHGDDQDQDPAVMREAADLLDRLRAGLDPPEHHDIAGQHADWRLRRGAELARERAERADDGESPAT